MDNPKVIWTHFTKLGFSCELKSSGIKIEESKSTNINTLSLKRELVGHIFINPLQF